ncbi:MAG: hypothetical protein ABWZ76_06940 [Acidimicrobiales bacterium]
MHPIERLRYVARASGADQALLVRETAQALAAFRDDPPGLVAACRRIVDRHPTSGPLWWLCARVLTAPDGQREAWAATEEIERDPTSAELALALSEASTVCVIGWPELAGDALPRRGDVEVLAVDSLGEGSGLVRRLMGAGVDAIDVPTAGLGAAVSASDVLVLEAVAMGTSGCIAVSGSLAAATVARHAGVPVWLVAGAGRLLPDRMWEALAGRLSAVAADPWELDEEVVPLALVDRVCGPAGLETPPDALLRVDCPVAPELFGGGQAPGTYLR